MKTSRPAPGISRRDFLKGAAAVAALAAGGCSFRTRRSGATPRAMVLGIDGMDPRLASAFMESGDMPNCRRLAECGAFHPMRTSNPPQSPVAWSNFLSGTNPGGHGIFDFIARDPSTLAPYLSTAHTADPKHRLPLGRYSIPLSSPGLKLLRKGHTFWDILQERGVESTAFKAPVCYPASDSKARLISDMGTPDIHGSYGIFSFYTDDPGMPPRQTAGGQIFSVSFEDGLATCSLRGPTNPFLAEPQDAIVRFTVERDTRSPRVCIRIQDRILLLDPGQWSDWIAVRFPMLPGLSSVSGICRFYLKASRPHLSLYVSPVDIDPADPASPISSPASYSRRVYRDLGYFYTQGLPEDTAALSARVFTDEEFLDQVHFVLAERLRQLDYVLNRFREGFLFFYMGTLDMASHAFWRVLDRRHPLHTPELAQRQGDVMRALYRQADGAVGRVLDAIDDRTLLFVISDHGFSSFRRQFNLNSWLMDNGYAQPLNPKDRGAPGFFEDVEWSGTRAYGLGINGLYLNVRGREPEGAVAPGDDYERLRTELIERLTGVRDPQNGEAVIAKVHRPEEIYSGPYVADAPDLLVCYAETYRASWDTVLGKYPREHILDNLDPWSGDHCMHPDFVPGVCFCNRPLSVDAPALHDLAPTLLAHYGIPAPSAMTGRNLGPAVRPGAGRDPS